MVNKLNCNKYITFVNTTICSGFNNHCSNRFPSIFLQLSFINEVNLKKESFNLQVLILKDSPIDLIIGRATIKLHQFNKITPSHFEDITTNLTPLQSNLEEFGDQKSQDLFELQQPTDMLSFSKTPLGVKAHKRDLCISTLGSAADETSGGPTVKKQTVRGGVVHNTNQPLCSCVHDLSQGSCLEGSHSPTSILSPETQTGVTMEKIFIYIFGTIISFEWKNWK